MESHSDGTRTAAQPGPVCRRIKHSMTPVPYTIRDSQTVAAAMKLMGTLRIEHLPVVNGGEIRGVISERDLRAQGIDPDDAESMLVAEVMRTNAYIVGPETPLADVLCKFAEESVAIVVDANAVTGIFTHTDAFHALNGVLDASVTLQRSFSAREIRERIRNEHIVLRGMIANVRGLAALVLQSDRSAAIALHAAAWSLYHTLLRHLDLEDTILAPALREADAFGPIRAAVLEEEHRRQREVLAGALGDLEDTEVSWVALAHDLTMLSKDLLTDMAHEEKDLLDAGLLAYEMLTSDCFTG